MLCCPNGSFLSGVLAELLGVLKNKEQLRALCTDSEPAVAEYLVLTSADFSTEVTSGVVPPPFRHPFGWGTENNVESLKLIPFLL